MFGSIISVAVVALAATASAAPAAKAATTCSFSGASGATAVASAKSSCATITLDSLVVPAGTTLDLTKLAKVSDGITISFCWEAC
jgi:polygalacturonase